MAKYLFPIAGAVGMFMFAYAAVAVFHWEVWWLHDIAEWGRYERAFLVVEAILIAAFGAAIGRLLLIGRGNDQT